MVWEYFQQDWKFNHQVTFDGPNRKIYIWPDVESYSVKELYSSWKEWLTLRDNAKYLPALRTIGGDPTSAGSFAGDIYFLVNDWQVVIVGDVEMQGVLYSDNPALKPYIIMPGGGLVATVSSLVQTVAPDLSGLDLSAINVPTATQIRQEMDANSTMLASIQTAVSSLPQAIRTELTPELTKVLLMENGLTETQAVMLTEIYKLYGLDPFSPLIVTNTSRTAGDIQQSINSNTNTTTVTRQL